MSYRPTTNEQLYQPEGTPDDFQADQERHALSGRMQHIQRKGETALDAIAWIGDHSSGILTGAESTALRAAMNQIQGILAQHQETAYRPRGER